MKTSLKTGLAGVSMLALLGGGTAVLLAGPAQAAAPTSSAYGLSATGAAPVGAAPSATSNSAERTATGAAASSDGTLRASATVRASAGKASVQVTGLSGLGGLLSGTATATCDGGKVSSSFSGTPAGPLGAKGTVTYGVTGSTADGAKFVIAAQVTVKAGSGTAASVINIGYAACGPDGGNPNPTPSNSPTGKPTTSPTASPTSSPTGKPTSSPTSSPTGKPTTSPTTTPPTGTPVPPAPPVPPVAPPVQPQDDHLPVTG
ncbi:hypothetical protein AB0M43_23625 [Longispora sp. NPDC051575]|uniref:hypothetical protein n=1 Tax=Longispora sp. NPDC051575 TaxID=3154943 RepID=UPI0034409F6F